MSLAILRADRSRAKWRKKLNKAFAGVHAGRKELQEAVTTTSTSHHLDRHEDGEDSMRQRNSQDVITPADNANAANPSSADTKAGANSASSATSVSSGPQGPQTLKDRFRMLVDVARRPFAGEAKGATAIFIIPFITTLREGLEGVVFIGGVSLGLPATSIPLPAVLGLFVGLLCGFIVFKAGSFSKVRLCVAGIGISGFSAVFFRKNQLTRVVLADSLLQLSGSIHVPVTCHRRWHGLAEYLLPPVLPVRGPCR